MLNKKIFIVIIILVLSLFGFFAIKSKISHGKELHLYLWADFISPDLIKKFEKQNNCKVVMDYFENNEVMHAKLKIGNIKNYYDVIMPSTYMASIMNRENLLEHLDKSKLSNIKYISTKKYLNKTEDQNLLYSIPYSISFSCIGYNSNILEKSDIDNSWGVIGNGKFHKNIIMLNDMRESISTALKYLGYSLNTIDDNELQQAKKLILEWKENIISFQGEELKSDLGYNLCKLVHYYSCDILKMNDEDDIEGKFNFVIPREGVSLGIEVLVIMEDAPNKDLAYAFLNFMNEPENCAENMEYIKCLTTNKPALDLLDKDTLKKITLPSNILKKSEIIRDLGEDTKKYIKIWDEIIIGNNIS